MLNWKCHHVLPTVREASHNQQAQNMGDPEHCTGQESALGKVWGQHHWEMANETHYGIPKSCKQLP